MKVGGEDVPREHHLVAATVTKTANRVASARLVYSDGSASQGNFALASAETFAPGSEIEILAGPNDEPVSLFKGIVVRQSIKVREKGGSQLVVDCRHAAFKLTVGRKNACHFDRKDSDVMESLLQAAGLTADVEATTTSHPQLVQYRSTDWDFLLTRAEANGKLVLTNDEKVTVKAPASGKSVVTLAFGATILELHAQIDARLQFSAVKSVTWDAAEQALVECEAADPGVTGPGNTSTDDLAAVAGLSSYELRHSSLDKDEAQAWADAAWLKSKLSKVSGTVKCIGLPTVNVGDVVTLAGLGDRYGGDVLVTGVRHDMTPGEGFRTHVAFGGVERFAAEEERSFSAPRAGALLPSAGGLSIGKVVSNEDEAGEHRVRVRLPLVDPSGDGVYARVASPDAGEERGFFFRPEVDDEVVVGFLDDDPRRPVILGMLHSSAKPAPLTGSDDNHEKVYQSRSKMRIYLNDDKCILLLETPGGNKITMSDEDKGIKIEDANGNVIALDADGVRIESAKAFALKAGAEVKMEASTSLEAKSGTEAMIEAGTALSAKGGTELKLEGASGAELSSSAATAIKGSQIKLG
ncbi:type VI secretion system tip protein VgrG [Polyangium sp. y55x31]|uniref:type VI secretion system tip protein VgrG n=1 Tax=Polyangium sp. y55x31 TaxID=3042688 RepID=UPI002482B74E|nr:type VI secretion system tip protein VgrG [Polyangium sp. y55x31]MDI1478922.1 type VI secretion system tip protein VgrG [Polyangium sp. y55x31]